MRFTKASILLLLCAGSTLSGCSALNIFKSKSDPYAYTSTPETYGVDTDSTLPPLNIECETEVLSLEETLMPCPHGAEASSIFIPMPTGDDGYNTYGTTDYTGENIPKQIGLRPQSTLDTSNTASNMTNRYGDLIRPVKHKGVYASLGMVAYDTINDNYGVQARLGYKITPTIGIEAEGSMGIIDDDMNGVDLGTKYAAGLFAIGRIPVTKNLSGLLRGGYHYTEFKQKSAPLVADLKTDGFAYGIGIEYAISHKDSIRVDYTRYETKSLASDSDAASIAYVHKF